MRIRVTPRNEESYIVELPDGPESDDMELADLLKLKEDARIEFVRELHLPIEPSRRINIGELSAE